MARGSPSARRATRFAAAIALCAACDEPQALPTPARVARWPCPAGWSPYPLGGCGPAALLCDADAGACPSSRAWHEPGETGGPPASDWAPEAGRGAPDERWSPEAGIPTCPPGWRRVGDVCDPALRADCPEGSGALPGGLCTTAEESPCPAGAFPEPDAVPGARVVRVRAGADPATADGSAERPFATVAAGLAGASGEVQVLVAPGEYREALEVTGRARVLGRCGVTLTGSAGRSTVSVRGAGAALDLRRVAIHGGASGVTAAAGARVTLRGVRITGASGFGVAAEDPGTMVIAEDLVVTGTTSRRDAAGRPVDGDALVARGGARLTASRVFADANHEAGAYAATGATLTLADSVVRATLPRSDGEFGEGLLAEARGVISASRTVVEASHATGVQAAGAGAALRMEDCVVRGTRPRPDDTRGWGAVAANGARVEGVRVLLADHRGAGALATGAGSALSLTASAVRGTRTNAERTGYGLVARDGGALTAEAVIVEGSEGVGAYARGGATLALDGVVVRGTTPGHIPLLQNGAVTDPGRRSVGVAAVGSELRATHVLLAGDVEAGVLAVGTPDAARVTLSDSVVRNERAAGIGMGLVAGPGAALEAARVSVVDSLVAGANATGAGASVTLDDCAVRRTRRGREGATTGALQALEGAALVARRVAVEDSAWCGASVGGGGSRLTIEDSAVLRSGRAVGVIEPETPSIAGLQAYRGGAVVARRVRVEDTVGEAVDALDPGTTVDLEDAVLRAGGGTYGVLARPGASVEARRVLVEDGARSGLFAFGDGTSVVFEDCVVRGTRPAPDGTEGHGLSALDGASLTVARTLVAGNGNAGVFGLRAETRVRLTDSAVRDTQPRPGGLGGAGVMVGLGAALEAERVLLAGNATVGVVTIASAARLDDVTVASTRSVGGAYGVGVMATGRGTLDARRLALLDARGVALAAVPVGASTLAEGAPTVTVEDLFVRGVRSSAVSFDRAGDGTTQRGASYGLHAGPGSALAVARAVIDDGGLGFFVAQGSLTLRQALIARQLDAAGAVTAATPRGALRLMDITFSNNLGDAIRTDDALPVVDALAVPTAPCPRGGCP